VKKKSSSRKAEGKKGSSRKAEVKVEQCDKEAGGK
jgi:hypothetical protein